MTCEFTGQTKTLFQTIDVDENGFDDDGTYLGEIQLYWI
jgi:hypothetical protein